MGVPSGNERASRIDRIIDGGVEKSDSEGWLFVSKGLETMGVDSEAV